MDKFSFNIGPGGIKSLRFLKVVCPSVCPFRKIVTQLTMTCSKLKIETLEQGVKYVQSQQ